MKPLPQLAFHVGFLLPASSLRQLAHSNLSLAGRGLAPGGGASRLSVGNLSEAHRAEKAYARETNVTEISFDGDVSAPAGPEGPRGGDPVGPELPCEDCNFTSAVREHRPDYYLTRAKREVAMLATLAALATSSISGGTAALLVFLLLLALCGGAVVLCSMGKSPGPSGGELLTQPSAPPSRPPTSGSLPARPSSGQDVFGRPPKDLYKGDEDYSPLCPDLVMGRHTMELYLRGNIAKFQQDCIVDLWSTLSTDEGYPNVRCCVHESETGGQSGVLLETHWSKPIAFIDTSHAVAPQGGPELPGLRYVTVRRAQTDMEHSGAVVPPFAVIEMAGKFMCVMVHCTADGQRGPVMMTMTCDYKNGSVQVMDGVGDLLARLESAASGAHRLLVTPGADISMILVGLISSLKLSGIHGE